ncbi:GntR family transcriptional regulator [Neobacillus muris]|uniref:GntR family transcriptional regulator n=1 Tax=Neobacillus muris TaxID=2941334 RepID=UPI0020415577|nr:GntR family transcriptional regulator [Neobacillus muris]
MSLNLDGSKPIYVQLAEWLENEILNGHFDSGQKIYSQYQLAEMFMINPATAAKGLNILADKSILYKKRGLGMFVSEEAKSIILTKRKTQTLTGLVEELAAEAKQLHVSIDELIKMIKAAMTRRAEE